MTQAFQRICAALLAPAGLAASTAASAALPYFFTITGTPTSCSCTAAGFTVTCTSLVYQLRSTASVATGSMYINGVFNGVPNSIAPGALSGTASGSVASSGSNLPAYSATFPYTLRFDIVPQDTNTDGVSASFTCNAPNSSFSN